jgi:autotransporter-associated beta strand protein
MIQQRRRLRAQVVRATAAAVSVGWAAAIAAQTWTVDANGAWGTAANWTPASVPNAIDAAATLGPVITAPRTITLNLPITLGSLSISGGSAYTVTGANTLTFDVTSGNALLGVSGTGAHTFSSAIALNDTLEINQGSTGTLTLSGGVSGAGGLIKNGTGSVALQAVSSYTGATQINAGTLFYNLGGAISAASTVTIGDGVGAAGSAILNLNQSMTTAQALNVTLQSDGLLIQNNNRLVRLGAVSGVGELRINSVVGNGFEIAGAAGNSTFSGIMTGGIAVNSADPNAGSRFTKTGTGTQTLSGNNTYVARTFINGGSLRAASNSALGVASAGFTNATFVFGAGSLELSNNITIGERLYLNGAGNGGAGALRNFSGNNTITGNVTLGWTGGTVTLAAASIGAEAGSTLTINGNLDGTQSLTKVGDGTLVLNGTNTWGTSTTVNGGVMRIGNAVSMPNALVLTVNGGTLDLNGFSKSVTNLSGVGGAVELGAATLTVNQAAAGTFAGAIGGSGALIKNGAATLVLTGANTYTGGTTVSAGTLQGNATSLQGNIVNNASVVFEQDAFGAYAGVLSGTGSLTKTGAGILVLTGANTYVGGTTVSAGTLQGDSTSLQGNISNDATVAFDQAAAGTYAGTISGSGNLLKSGAGTLTLTASNTHAGGTSLNGGALAVASDAQLGTGALTFDGGTLQTNAAFSSSKAITLLGAGTIDSNGFAVNLGGAVTGAGSLIKNGSGTLTLAGANTYTGGTTVNEGTLQGSSTSLQGDIANNAAVVFDQASSGTYNGVMSGNGSLTKAGSGTLMLTGANTYSGGTIVSAGTLQGNSTSLRGDIANAASVVFEQDALGTYAGVLSGSGSLTKSGAGTLVLTGANSYSGGTTVTAGTLQGNSTSLQGNIANNSALVFDQAVAGAYSGNISGTGTLVKTGAGTLTLTGANTHAGDTSISAGTLAVASDAQLGTGALAFNGGTLQTNAAFTSSKAVTLLGAGTIDSNGFAVDLGGAIAGAGPLTKSGAGTLTLAGTNTYSGGTTVTAGTLQGSSTSLQGDILNNAAVIFDQASSGTYGGVMSGTGSLTKSGGGTLILTSAQTYTGGTAVSGGTLQGSTSSLRGAIVNKANVVFDQAADGIYADSMTGTGSMTKLGSGVLTISGANTYAGATAVDVGTLNVLGSMTSNIALASGTTLTGTGTVGGINAAAGSVVAPGSLTAPLTANGNYLHSDGAVFRVLANASGSASRLNVNGTATLAGGVVDVLAEDGSYAASTRYTILNATSGVSGTLGSVNTNLVFLTPTLQYDFNNVFLTLARNDADFASVAQTPNQLAVAQALDNAADAGAGGDMGNVLADLSTLSAPAARSAFESLDGLIYTLLPTIGVTDVTLFNRATSSRLRDSRQTTTSPRLAFNDSTLVTQRLASVAGGAAASEPSRNLWASAYGSDGDLEGDASSGDYDYRIAGFVLGVDTELGKNWVAGVSTGFSDWSVRNDGRGDRADVNAWRIAAYTRFTSGALRLDGVVGYGNIQYDSDRRIVFATVDRTASADYYADQFTAFVSGGYRFTAGSYGIEPFAALQWVDESRDAFTESGAASVDLSVTDESYRSTRGIVGARVDRDFDADGGTGHVELRAGYSREFSGVPTLNATLVGDPTQTSMGIAVENFGRNYGFLGAGASLTTDDGATVFIDASVDFQSNGGSAAVLAGVRTTW